MINPLEAFIYQRVKTPKAGDVEEILSIFEEKTFSKGTRFKERDTQIKQLGFLTSGSSRSYLVNKKGNEVTGHVSLVNTFLSDIVSVRTRDKTPTIIEFLEDAQVLVAPMDKVRNLLETNLVFNILIREYIADNTVEIVKKQLMFMTGTAKDRYQYLLETNPHLVKRFPLRFIASMIGVTPTQLSRIRKEKS